MEMTHIAAYIIVPETGRKAFFVTCNELSERTRLATPKVFNKSAQRGGGGMPGR